jgi:hypothetical protein
LILVKRNHLSNHKKVILFPVASWRFFDYAEGANNAIDEWYQALSEEEQDTFDALLKQNQKIDLPIHWGGMKFMQGECKKEGVWEWRFRADGPQQRILGVFGTQRKHAVFLIGCYHKQQVYKPPECLTTAVKRAKAVREGSANVTERTIDSNF